MATTDPAGARIFYSELFGWEAELIEADGKLVYVNTKNAGSQNEGNMPTAEQRDGAPPYWLAYFTVSSCDGVAAKVRGLDGEVLTV
ncbi:MAG: hypothetical protein AVDCRST_MAG14-813 [uncultured Rubrobacteraceae bacterium]|uniref:VOC domain-containing protein n=1 Tax=uncultured Rubrobacteraceae bacterium TaxID=349277 RepID=A0A6J4QNM9_9ACTN|nr:MAG: hypothetical protein AVDCRST_MAG14-813 [uncultured Rubrobacteraceae bacterium]